MSLTRNGLHRRFKDHKIIIQNNVGGGGRYSVEVLDSLTVLGTCDTLLEAETLIEDYIERKAEDAAEVG
jgi:hypothetical protein